MRKLAATRPKFDRFRFRPLSILLMALVWVVLWGSLTPMMIVSGLLLGYVVTLVFPLPPINWEGRFRPIGFIKLIGHLLGDLVVSSFRVLRLAFEKEVNLNAGIVRVDLASDHDLYQVQVAQVISLVPGTVVVEVVRHPRRLYLHAIDLVGDDPVAKIQSMTHDIESRVLHAFGSKAEIEAFEVQLAELREAERLKKQPSHEDPELEEDDDS